MAHVMQATSSDFNAELLTYNVSFTDQTNSVSGYAWTWEVQRVNGQTGLSHFNFIDGILCATEEEAGTLREHIEGAYYSQDAGSTWNYVAPTWAEDGSTSGSGNNSNCYEGEVLKIDFGGDDLPTAIIADCSRQIHGRNTERCAEFHDATGAAQTCDLIQYAALCPINGNIGVLQIGLGGFHEALAAQHAADHAWQGAGEDSAVLGGAAVQHFNCVGDTWVFKAIHWFFPC
jgi:hypothetical protein